MFLFLYDIVYLKQSVGFQSLRAALYHRENLNVTGQLLIKISSNTWYLVSYGHGKSATSVLIIRIGKSTFYISIFFIYFFFITSNKDKDPTKKFGEELIGGF